MCISLGSTVIFPKSETAMLSSNNLLRTVITLVSIHYFYPQYITNCWQLLLSSTIQNPPPLCNKLLMTAVVYLVECSVLPGFHLTPLSGSVGCQFDSNLSAKRLFFKCFLFKQSRTTQYATLAQWVLRSWNIFRWSLLFRWWNIVQGGDPFMQFLALQVF